jgi:hypothetical protein
VASIEERRTVPVPVTEPVKRDPTSEWMLEVTTHLERQTARLQAVEKSLDQNTAAVASAAAAATAAAMALGRIAKTEEDRLAFDREDRNHRNAWLARVWSSNAIQLLIVGLVVAVLNVLGVSYLVDRVFPVVGGNTSVTHGTPADPRTP